MTKQLATIALLLFALPGLAFGQDVTVSSNITGDVTWTSANTYILDGFVFVEPGATLTIEAGTVVKGNPGQAENASALIVARGGQLFAEGTSSDPIIFTAVSDPLDGTTLPTRGLWGGLIVLGDASLNSSPGVTQIEGIPTNEPLGEYGGMNDEDNSGVIRYVSIRYGGTDIGAGNEINGLTMGGVGSGTTVEFVEVFRNADDGFEWFGGTVDAKWLISAHNADDAFDIDEGWRGRGQYFFSIQAEDDGDHAGEHDGGTDPEDGMPFTTPVIANATYIGSSLASGNANNGLGLLFRDNFGGSYYNSVLTEFFGTAGISIEDLESGEDSRARLDEGTIVVANNVWWDFGGQNDLNEIGNNEQWTIDHLAANGNEIVEPGIRGISRTDDGGLDPRPTASSPLLTGGADLEDDWFDNVNFRGAFGTTNWAAGWTALDELGYMGDLPAGDPGQVLVAENITGDVTWTPDNEYVLSGFVFVEPGATLTIEPGTVVKGNPGQGENASALIVARGGQLFAEGTAAAPIIFTSVTDPLDGTTLPTRGLWGGLIVLGDASLNSSPGVSQIEGIPTNEPLGEYGGMNDEDNSGVIRYVSIRYGGTDIGAGNEINGLTMGGVGSGTTVEFVEVFRNADDGFEWFGGTVDAKWLISAHNADDAFDIDEGWRGRGQYFFSIQAEDDGDHAGEHDGGTDPEDGMPFTTPVIANATYIGSSLASGNANNGLGLLFRDNFGGSYYNSVLTEFFGTAGISIEDLESGEDSRARLDEGTIVVANNVWWDFGGQNDLNEIGNNEQWTIDHLAANGNEIVEPGIRGISRTDDAGLDPRPTASSPLLTGGADLEDDWFDNVNYRGAFGTSNWAAGWSALDQLGYMGDLPAGDPGQVLVAENITGDVTWTPDNEYILSGFIFVEPGATLTIEPGTVVKGNPGQGENASALIVARGGQLFAGGTADAPIIFTSVTDPLDGTTLPTRGLWGGLIVLGDASLNSSPGVSQIEGIPTNEPLGEYGGMNDEDNSGVIRYVSIRYGGTDIGAGNEINGLTMGGVGSGTTVEFVEVFRNADDGFEWFGGTVDAKWLISAHNADDAFDIDEGWRGRGQYFFSIQAEDDGDHAGEHDGGTDPEDGMPFTTPVIANATYIGSSLASGNANNGLGLLFRDNFGGSYYNSVLTEFFGTAGISIEDLDSGEDSRARLDEGTIVVANNVWWDFGGQNDLNEIGNNEQWTIDHLAANGNEIVEPGIRGISRTDDAGLDPRPTASSPLLTGGADLEDDWFDNVNYRGAFGSSNWAAGWSALDQLGYMGDLPAGDPGQVSVFENITEDATWTPDNEYILSGFVFVEPGVTLTIEPGTVVKGSPGQAENASALIVARGAQIFAEGTADDPIIFTALSDDVNDPADLPVDARGLWGGLIVLGDASLNSSPGVTQIEGIPTNEPLGEYGGMNDEDNSGVVRYVSIRYGGTDIGAGNEINGLTMGGVGSGTTVEFVEVYNNADDGFEWFGGTVDAKWLVSAFNADDAFDIDEGWRGRGQYFFSIQGEDDGDHAGEHDGGTDPEDGMPFTTPVIANATYVGSGLASGNANNGLGLLFRDNFGGSYYNSVLTEFFGTAGISIEDLDSGEDSRARLDEGTIVVANNLWWDFGGSNDINDIGNGEDWTIAHLTANNNDIAEPMLAGISRTNDGGLDPRPNMDSPLLGAGADLGDDWFDAVDYRGAFDLDLWVEGWTALSDLGYLGDLVDRTNIAIEPISDEIPEAFTLMQNYPNPFNPTTTIEFTVDATQFVTLKVFDVIGREVEVLANEVLNAGRYEYQFDAANLPSGMYFYQIVGEKATVTKTMLLLK